jgi:hypothetical protein
MPARALFVAVPTGTARITGPVPGEDFGSWLLVEVEGPFQDEAALLRAASDVLAEVRPSLSNVPELLSDWFELNSDVLCDALSTLGSECETVSLQ